MDTNKVRELTVAAATACGGRLWPNRMGFGARGWEYALNETRGGWNALWRSRGSSPSRLGHGETPAAARAAARADDAYDARRRRIEQGD